MADATEGTSVDVGVSDAELFEGAAAETPADVPVAETLDPEPVIQEQPRDEKGKFAKIEETPAVVEAAKPVVDDNGALVPSWRVREINEEKRQERTAREAAETERNQLRSQLEQLQRQAAKPAEQPKPEAKPDPLLDPEGYEKYLERRFDDRLLSERRETSLRMAHRTYKEEFDTAYAAAQQAMGRGDHSLAARMSNSADPGETLIEWHREQKVKQEVGNDPNAWLEKKLEERLKDPAFLAKAIEKAKGAALTNTNQQARPAVELPPSLSNSSRAGNTSTSADDSDVSDEALFRYAVR